ncbi:hypothetical protein BV25DRAFT_1792695 [Artomyces pyxidatus]|uniref:Uncharacterized protein n=1 Tax=Artomyces pyxidatus TaxID=48021 RepID=A0ACB8TKW7_9AGAM|nr:hypothetical protein BV25DRAFT_1792695 [Artomyces pyxidatus]
MAKSTRSKIKRAHRAHKRTDSVYAAIAADRVRRLHDKLAAVVESKVEETTEEGMPESMELDGAASPSATKKISTHGPRNSRRESWRASKGLAPRPEARGMNRQGTVAARRKSGRPNRRR